MVRLALREKMDAVPEGLDWTCFQKTMDKHRIYPLVIRGLRRFSAEQLEPYPVLKRYSALQNQYSGSALKRMQTLAAVAKAMEDAGIPMLSMKGPLLSIELYGDPSMRHSHDLDILVPTGEFLRASSCLQKMGFVPVENPHLKTQKRLEANLRYTSDNHGEFELGDQCVELHWRSTNQNEVSFEQLWENREQKMLLGTQVWVMGQRDKLPHLFAHAANHGFARLRWLLDLYEFQKRPDFSWDVLWEDMRKLENGCLLLETLIVLNRWKVLPMGETTVGTLTVKREGDQVLIRCGEDMAEEVAHAVDLSEGAWTLMEREFIPEDPAYQAYRKMLPTKAVRKSLWNRLLGKLQPNSADFALIDLPDRWFWLYYFIRPVYWVWRKLTGGRT